MNNNIFSKIYKWLCLGLLITFISGYMLSTNTSLIYALFSGKLYLLLFIAEIIIAIVLGARINKLSQSTATILYLLYTFLTGLTFSSIFLLYQMSSIIFIFLATSIVFLLFALIGKHTKIDLTKFGTFLFMGLISIIILELINALFLNNSLNLLLCIIGIAIFLGYIAYDVQKIKKLNEFGMDENKLAIIGAFDLYLDFINLFIRLLELFGRKRD